MRLLYIAIIFRSKLYHTLNIYYTAVIYYIALNIKYSLKVWCVLLNISLFAVFWSFLPYQKALRVYAAYPSVFLRCCDTFCLRVSNHGNFQLFFCIHLEIHDYCCIRYSLFSTQTCKRMIRERTNVIGENLAMKTISNCVLLLLVYAWPCNSYKVVNKKWFILVYHRYLSVCVHQYTFFIWKGIFLGKNFCYFLLGAAKNKRIFFRSNHALLNTTTATCFAALSSICYKSIKFCSIVTCFSRQKNNV